MIDFLAGPQPLHDVDGLHEPRHTVLARGSRGCQLRLAVANPDAENHPALGYLVEGRDILSDLNGVMQR